MQDTAHHLGVSWDVVKDIQKKYLRRKFARPKLSDMKYLAIDEISIGKGHKYVTVVLDIISGAVVHVGEGKGADALRKFWRRLMRSGAQVKAVAIDMSPAYRAAVSENLPNAAIVFDHFHIIKLYNDRLSEYRRQLSYEAATKTQKMVLKGTRWLLLKNPCNLNAQRNEQERLEEALRINQPLATVYYMKEDLRTLWGYENSGQADKFLSDWIARAKVSGIAMLKAFARTLQEHREGILAYYDHPISTAALEGTNNKIKTMKRQAYGFRDIEFFKLKIMAIHESRYALVG
jgi:transposase